MKRALIILALLPLALRAQEATSQNNERLRKGLEQFPESDTNKDGILTMQEGLAFLAKKKNKAAPGQPPKDAPPITMKNISYGPHQRNVLDFWKAPSTTPTPLVFFIHGGGFTAGDKSQASGKIIKQCLDAGISFAAINYRYRTQAPIQDVLRDCARAVQFVRSKAAEWNVDKVRIASYGGSAGAGTSLWLAFHNDLADPGNADPVLRESTRLVCAGATATQFSYDAPEWEKLFSAEEIKKFGDPDWPAFYGFKTEAEARSPEGLKVMDDCDMHALISKDDPPVFLNTTQNGGPVTDRGSYLHHPMHADAVRKRCVEIGVPVIADLPGLNIKPDSDQPANIADFLIGHLKPKQHDPAQ